MVQNHRLFHVSGARGIAGGHGVEIVSFRLETTFGRANYGLLKADFEEKLPDAGAKVAFSGV